MTSSWQLYGNFHILPKINLKSSWSTQVHEYSFISPLYKSDYRRALKLNRTLRLTDDISTLNSDGAHQIYPSSLVLNQKNVDDIEADVLDLNISIKDGKYILMFMIKVTNLNL